MEWGHSTKILQYLLYLYYTIFGRGFVASTSMIHKQLTSERVAFCALACRIRLARISAESASNLPRQKTGKSNSNTNASLCKFQK